LRAGGFRPILGGTRTIEEGALRVRLIARLVLALTAALLAGAPLASPAPAAETASSYCFTRELDDGRPRQSCIRLATYGADVCAAIERDALAAGLPPGYFARLIWQESHFDANAVSRAGAEGIAQFMPETGRLQGLGNPYNPAEALWRSAHYLDALRGRFGNLGLAAAAYNGGESRVGRFIAGTGYLAAETLDYVQIVTGVPVTEWLAGDVDKADYALADDKPFDAACRELAATSRLKRFTPPTAIIQPWGIQLAEFFSSATARRAFSRIQSAHPEVLGDETLMLVARWNPNFGRALRYTAEVGRQSREAAEKLCAELRQAGGSCLVIRN
jgi:hypothetical protein